MYYYSYYCLCQSSLFWWWEILSTNMYWMNIWIKWYMGGGLKIQKSICKGGKWINYKTPKFVMLWLSHSLLIKVLKKTLKDPKVFFFNKGNQSVADRQTDRQTKWYRASSRIWAKLHGKRTFIHLKAFLFFFV